MVSFSSWGIFSSTQNALRKGVWCDNQKGGHPQRDPGMDVLPVAAPHKCLLIATMFCSLFLRQGTLPATQNHNDLSLKYQILLM